MLVDSHCHLDFKDFADELPDVVARAETAGVGMMLTICTQVSKFPQVLAVAEQFDNVYCTVGVHPHEAEPECNVTADRLIEIAANPKVIGIGETGLDFHYEHSPRDIQTRLFREHIKAARETGLPLVIHSREAEEETATILRQEMGQGAFSGVMHCFSSKAELARAALDVGLYISLAGILTFKKADDLRETAREVPLDRLLVETDSPYLAPIPHRGKRNEPSFVQHTAEKLAELKGLTPSEMADKTTDNFFRLFSKARNPHAVTP